MNNAVTKVTQPKPTYQLETKYSRNQNFQLFPLEKINANPSLKLKELHLQNVINEANYDAVYQLSNEDPAVSEEKLISDWTFKCLNSRIDDKNNVDTSSDINNLAKNTSLQPFGKTFTRGFILSWVIMLIKTKGSNAFLSNGKLNPKIVNDSIKNLLNNLKPKNEVYRKALNELLGSTIKTSIFNKNSISIGEYLKDVTLDEKTGIVKFGDSNYGNNTFKLYNSDSSKNSIVDKKLIYLEQFIVTANSEKDYQLIQDSINTYINTSDTLLIKDYIQHDIKELENKKNAVDDSIKNLKFIYLQIYNSSNIQLNNLANDKIKVIVKSLAEQREVLQNILKIKLSFSSIERLEEFQIITFNVFKDETNLDNKKNIAINMHKALGEYKNIFSELIKNNGFVEDDFTTINSSNQKKKPIINQLKDLMNEYATFINANNSEMLLNKTIHTIRNDGNAGIGYHNSCGSLAVYDAFQQISQEPSSFNETKRLAFAKKFKDNIYNTSLDIINFHESINSADIKINKSADYILIRNKGIEDACKELNFLINNPLSEEQIIQLADKTISYSNLSNEKFYKHYELEDTFKEFSALLNVLYGNYRNQFISSFLINNIESIKTHITTLNKDLLRLKNNIDSSEYNKTSIYKLESENTIKNLTELHEKINTNNIDIQTFNISELFSIYKSMNDVFDVISIYDIEDIDRTNMKLIESKKQKYHNNYKSSTLTVAQISIGLSEYGFIHDSILPLTNNYNKLVRYKHISKPEFNIILMHSPGHWESVDYNKLGYVGYQ